MNVVILVVWLQLSYVGGCQFDARLDGSTWFRGYHTEGAAESTQSVHPTSGQSQPRYKYDIFHRGQVKTYLVPNETHPIDQWDCIEMRRLTVGVNTHFVCVVKHKEKGEFQCRQYSPTPPGAMLMRRHTAGSSQPDIEMCTELLKQTTNVDILVVYVGGLVAQAPCPWQPGTYHSDIRYADSANHSLRNCSATISLHGAKLSTHGCALTDSYRHPFNSKLFCIASWFEGVPIEGGSVGDGYSLLYRYDLPSSKYHFYVAKYSYRQNHELKLMLKVSPADRVSFSLVTHVEYVDMWHSALRLFPIRLETTSENPILREASTDNTAATPTDVTTSGFTTSARGRTTWGQTRRTSTERGTVTAVSCLLLPCLNGGTCKSDGTHGCLCPPNTIGAYCEKVAGQSTRDVKKPSCEETTSSANSTPGDDTSATSGNDGTAQQQHVVTACLLPLTISFMLLSAVLCVFGCCRKPRPLLFDDRKELLEEAGYINGPTAAEPDVTGRPYLVPSVNAAQAWFPDYGHGASGMVDSTDDKHFPPDTAKKSETVKFAAQ